MKRFYLIFLLATAVSCTTNHFDSIHKSDSGKASSNLLSYEEAVAIAIDAAQILEGDASTRSVSGRSAIDVKPLTKIGTRSGAVGLDTLLYVVNYNDNQGFALILAERNTETPLVGVAEQGYYDPAIGSENINFNYYLETVVASIPHHDVNHPLSPDDNPSPDPQYFEHGYMDNYHWVVDSLYTPLINVNWGQRGIYGAYSPNYISGCVATAVGQILTYYAEPDTLHLTFANAPSDYISFDWESINDQEEGYSEVIRQQIGLLLREIGNRVNMDYSLSYQSSAYMSDAIAFLRSLDYNCTPYNGFFSWIECINEIKNGYAVLMSGVNTNDYSGHAWVADGYIYRHEVADSLYIHSNGFVELIQSNVPTGDYCELIHCNWGWDGDSNGYYLPFYFDAYGASTILDNEQGVPIFGGYAFYDNNFARYIIKNT